MTRNIQICIHMQLEKINDKMQNAKCKKKDLGQEISFKIFFCISNFIYFFMAVNVW